MAASVAGCSLSAWRSRGDDRLLDRAARRRLSGHRSRDVRALRGPPRAGRDPHLAPAFPTSPGSRDERRRRGLQQQSFATSLFTAAAAVVAQPASPRVESRANCRAARHRRRRCPPTLGNTSAGLAAAPTHFSASTCSRRPSGARRATTHRVPARPGSEPGDGLHCSHVGASPPGRAPLQARGRPVGVVASDLPRDRVVGSRGNLGRRCGSTARRNVRGSSCIAGWRPGGQARQHGGLRPSLSGQATEAAACLARLERLEGSGARAANPTAR